MFGLVKLLTLVSIAAVSVLGICLLAPQGAEQGASPNHLPADFLSASRHSHAQSGEDRYDIAITQVSGANSPENSEATTRSVPVYDNLAYRDYDGSVDSVAKLAESRGTAASALLRGLLDDPSPSIREEAVEALAAIGGDDVYVSLAYALSDPNRMVRQLAIESLAQDGSDEAVGALAITLSEHDEDLRVLAVEELASIGSVASKMLLQRFLSDESRRVRAIVAEN
ncbi:MAG: HEAT repeat domain-containing protein [Gammaproteobacteria bacterium]|nr:HEAT repeat domain-containing protein [Gammaproteobacteria bacterium]